MNVLIVRLGAMGDIIHAVPAAAALRSAFPDARIDWLVEAKHRETVELVTVVDRIIVLERSSIAGWIDVARRLRQVRYDAAIDLQGLMKSAVLARASGAARVIGFSIWHLREKAARPFYSESAPTSIDRTASSEPRTASVADRGARSEERGARNEHVILKNIRLLRTLGVTDERIVFPLAQVQSGAVGRVRATIGEGPFALINPGAGWPNKRWPPERFAEVAAFLRDVRQLPSVIIWGPGEETLARRIVETSAGSAHLAPPTGIAELLELSREAALMIAGDTGPMQLAAAAGTPIVAIFGPTDPARNGPWSADDVTVTRFATCRCHYDRRCHQPDWCLADVQVAEVTAAIQQRFLNLARTNPSDHRTAINDPRRASVADRTANSEPRTAIELQPDRTANSEPRTASVADRTANREPRTAIDARGARREERGASVADRTANREPRTAIRKIARLRVPAGFAFGIVAMWLAQPTPASLAAGAAVAVLGEGMRLWAAGHLEKGREVTRSGPYSFTRHPLYAGSTIIGAGLVIASRSAAVAAMVVLYLGVTLTAAIRVEEAHLTQKFGDAYPEYREGRTPDAHRRFSLERAMRNREYRAIAGLAFALALLAWKTR